MEPKEFWLKQIKKLEKTKDFEAGVTYANKIKEIDDSKNKPEFWYKNGLAYLEIQEYEKALSCFDKDLELNKPNFETLYQKGIVFYFLKKNLEAIEWFNKAWEIKYSDYLKTQEQIKMLKEHKEFEKSVFHTRKLNKMDALPQGFWHYQALVLTELEKYQEATKCYDKALLIKKDDALILFDKAKSEYLQGEEGNCIHLLKKVFTGVDENILKQRLKQILFFPNLLK